MKNAHIIGTGGLSKELIGYILGENTKRYHIKGCWGEKPFNNIKYNNFYKGNMSLFLKNYQKNDVVFIAIANPKIRESIYNELHEYDLNFDSYVHPSCEISEFAEIGIGCILSPFTMLTGDPVLKNFIFTNTEVVVGHDSIVNDFCTLYPKVEICGDCVIGEKCILGINSIVLPGLNMCPKSKLDAGSILRESIEKPWIYSGNPAKRI